MVFRDGGRLRGSTERRLRLPKMLPAGLGWLKNVLLLFGITVGAELEGNERHLQTRKVRTLKVVEVTSKKRK